MSVAVFPGQGSQHVGMAKELHESFAIVRETFEEASEAVRKDLRKLCFEGPESDLLATENTQPCLLTASVAAFRVAQKEWGFTPQAVAGHSLGEYSALVAIGALPLASAARWVRERGQAMQRAVPAGEGTMAAILNLNDDLIGTLCEQASAAARAKRSADACAITVEPVVEPANYNSPGQIVIAGSQDAVSEAIALIKAGGTFAGAKAIPLSVSAPFHCRLMRPARDRMAELFGSATPNEKPKNFACAYVPNRTARINREPGTVFELLVDQVDHPVLWKQSVETLLDAGHTRYVECGPGKVLQGLIKRIAQPRGQSAQLFGISDLATLKATELGAKA